MTTQPMTAQQLISQEEALALPSLSELDAIDIGLSITADARSRSLPISVEIWRAGRLVFRAALPGTAGHNDASLDGKRRVVERFAHSTLWVGALFSERGTTFEAMTGLGRPEFMVAGGGVPLTIAGTGVVGIALVSGLTQQEDHDLIIEALTRRSNLGLDAAAAEDHGTR